MDSNFESAGGVSGGSSMPDPGGLPEVESAGGFGNMSSQSLTDSNSGWLNYLQDGVDNGYYKTETEGIFSLDEVMSDAQAEMSEVEKIQDWDIMQIPGTSHEKLSGLAEMSDEDISLLEESEVSEPKISVENNEGKDIKEEKVTYGKRTEGLENKEDKLSFEEQIIKLQAETMKLMAESINSRVNNKDLEELKKKIKKLIDELEAEKEVKGSKKAMLLTGLFSAVLLLLRVGEEGSKKLENEVKSAG